MLRKLIATTAFRHALWFLAVYLIAAFLLVGYIYWNTNIVFMRKLVAEIGQDAQELADDYAAGGVARLVAQLRQRAARPGVALYRLANDRGAVLAGNIALPNPAPVPSDLWQEFAYQRLLLGAGQLRLGGGHVYALPDGLILIVGRDISELRQFEQVITSALAWSMGLTLVFGLPLGFVLARRMLARVDRVSRTCEQIMSGDLTRRMKLSGSGDELDRLMVNLNRMLDRIQVLMDASKQISDNIAHDLKTPLTRLRSQAEAALRDSHAPPESQRAALEKVIVEADRLIALFNASLTIAEIEAGARPIRETQVDMAEIFSDIREMYEPVADEMGAAIDVDDADAAMVIGDRNLIAQAITNLIDNALKYGAGQDGVARIALRQKLRDGWVEIMVADRGLGIAAEERARVVDRFVRLENSRHAPGSGLGLSLALAVATAHHGALIFADNDPGLRAVLRLPRAS